MSRVLRIPQHSVRKYSEIDGRHQADCQRQPQRKRNRHYRNFPSRFAHVHHHNDAQVIIGTHPAVDHADDREPDQIGLHRRAEQAPRLADGLTGERNIHSGHAIRGIAQRDDQRLSEHERNRRIAAVTMADARRTAERLFGDGALSVVLVGRPAGV